MSTELSIRAQDLVGNVEPVASGYKALVDLCLFRQADLVTSKARKALRRASGNLDAVLNTMESNSVSSGTVRIPAGTVLTPREAKTMVVAGVETTYDVVHSGRAYFQDLENLPISSDVAGLPGFQAPRVPRGRGNTAVTTSRF